MRALRYGAIVGVPFLWILALIALAGQAAGLSAYALVVLGAWAGLCAGVGLTTFLYATGPE